MPAYISLGLTTALPLSWDQEAVFNHLKEFAAFEFISEFFEVIDGKLYRISYSNGLSTITELFPDYQYREWNPNTWIKDYTYSEWYIDILQAWNAKGIRGDITYNEWSNIYISIFVPFYNGKTQAIKFSGLNKSLEVCGIDAGYAIASELNLPEYFSNALSVAQEFLFLVRISG